MKCYKAHLKKAFIDLWDNLKLKSPITISEDELDVLIDGKSITKNSDSGEPYKLNYKDLEMITTCD